MSVKVNCIVCRGTKRVDKIGGLHTKECPGCNGLGKVEKCPISDSPILALNAEEILDQKEDKLEPTFKTKEGIIKNGKGKR